MTDEVKRPPRNTIPGLRRPPRSIGGHSYHRQVDETVKTQEDVRKALQRTVPSLFGGNTSTTYSHQQQSLADESSDGTPPTSLSPIDSQAAKLAAAAAHSSQDTGDGCMGGCFGKIFESKSRRRQREEKERLMAEARIQQARAKAREFAESLEADLRRLKEVQSAAAERVRKAVEERRRSGEDEMRIRVEMARDPAMQLLCSELTAANDDVNERSTQLLTLRHALREEERSEKVMQVSEAWNAIHSTLTRDKAKLAHTERAATDLSLAVQSWRQVRSNTESATKQVARILDPRASSAVSSEEATLGALDSLLGSLPPQTQTVAAASPELSIKPAEMSVESAPTHSDRSRMYAIEIA